MMNYSNLLMRSWREMNCGQAAVEGLRRMGLEKAASFVPVDQASAARALRVQEGGWYLAGSELRAAIRGDLVATACERADTYGLVLVLDRVLGLTSTPSLGVHCVRLRRLQRVLGVYRWGGERR